MVLSSGVPLSVLHSTSRSLLIAIIVSFITPLHSMRWFHLIDKARGVDAAGWERDGSTNIQGAMASDVLPTGIVAGDEQKNRDDSCIGGGRRPATTVGHGGTTAGMTTQSDD